MKIIKIFIKIFLILLISNTSWSINKQKKIIQSGIFSKLFIKNFLRKGTEIVVEKQIIKSSKDFFLANSENRIKHLHGLSNLNLKQLYKDVVSKEIMMSRLDNDMSFKIGYKIRQEFLDEADIRLNEIFDGNYQNLTQIEWISNEIEKLKVNPFISELNIFSLIDFLKNRSNDFLPNKEWDLERRNIIVKHLKRLSKDELSQLSTTFRRIRLRYIENNIDRLPINDDPNISRYKPKTNNIFIREEFELKKKRKKYEPTLRIIDKNMKSCKDDESFYDLFSLVNGGKPTVNDIRVIKKIFYKINLSKLNIKYKTNNYDNVLLLRIQNESKLVASTTQKKVIFDYDQSNDFENFLLIHQGYNVIFDGIVTKELAATLSKCGFYFLASIKSISPLLLKKPFNPKLIFITSNSVDNVKAIFECDDKMAIDILKSIPNIKKMPNTLIVDSYQSYLNEINNLEIGEVAIPIFHNANEEILFLDKRVQINDLKVGISCNTYRIENSNFISTDFIDYDCVIKALSKSQIDFFKDFIRNSTNGDLKKTFNRNYMSYMFNFSKNFNECVSINDKRVKFMLIAGGGATSGGVVYLISEFND